MSHNLYVIRFTHVTKTVFQPKPEVQRLGSRLHIQVCRIQLLQCVAERCRELQCVAVCCSVLFTFAHTGLSDSIVAVCCKLLQRVAACCSVLQHVTERCSVLQRVAVYGSVLKCVAEF